MLATRFLTSTVDGDLTDDIQLITAPDLNPPGNPPVPEPVSGLLQSVTVTGDVLGDILIVDDPLIPSNRASIEGLVVEGSFGTSSNPIVVLVDTAVEELTAGEINATIIGANDIFVGSVHRILATTTNGGSGDFNGALATREIVSDTGNVGFIQTDGDLNANIFIGDSLVLGDGSISTGPAGLKGQVTVGADSGSSVWTGDVTIGSTSLALNYTDTAASLGGGAVGLVPFDLHGSDSLPADGTGAGYAGASMAAPSPTNPIFVRHYGPVRFDTTSGASPVIIKGRVGDDANYADLTGCFTVEMAGSGDETRLKITPDYQLPNTSEWRITPVLVDDLPMNQTRLISTVNGDSSDPSVASYVYDFCVGTGVGIEDCEADVDGSGCVDFNDLVANLFLFTPAPLCMGQPAGDVDDSGATDFNDLVAKLFVFGTECPSCDGAVSLGCTGGASAASFVEPENYPAHCEALLAECGFSTMTEYLQYVETLTLEEQYEEALAVAVTAAEILSQSTE